MFPLVKIDLAHPPLQVIGPYVKSNKHLIKVNHGFDFYKGNYNAMNNYLRSIDWHSILLTQCIPSSKFRL